MAELTDHRDRIASLLDLDPGELDVPGATQTVTFYAHYDGQPIDQPDWQTEPFAPALLDGVLAAGGAPVPLPASGDDIDPEWRLYARSAGDDKMPVVALMHVLDAMAAAGKDLMRLTLGTRDPLLPDTRRLAAALERRGVPCEAHYYPGEVHAFQAFVFEVFQRRGHDRQRRAQFV